MNQLLLVLIILLSCPGWAGRGDHILQSTWADADSPLGTSPTSAFWRDAGVIYMDSDNYGKVDAKYRTEIRSRWTNKNLFFLFICPYEDLYLKPILAASGETNELWNWDVAEAFIGSDFEHIRRYKEFEISPRGEWVDLDINLDKPLPEGGWKWDSGFEVSARIDKNARVWYGAMKIPYSAIDTRPAAEGNTLRINFFRSQGSPSARHQIAWRAPMSESFHEPEKFGTLRLAKK